MNYPNISKSLGWSQVMSTTEGVFLQPEEAAKIEKDLARVNAAVGSAGGNATEITARDKRIKELESQVATLSKSQGNVFNGRKVEPIDYTLIDRATGACNRAAENKKKQPV